MAALLFLSCFLNSIVIINSLCIDRKVTTVSSFTLDTMQYDQYIVFDAINCADHDFAPTLTLSDSLSSFTSKSFYYSFDAWTAEGGDAIILRLRPDGNQSDIEIARCTNCFPQQSNVTMWIAWDISDSISLGLGSIINQQTLVTANYSKYYGDSRLEYVAVWSIIGDCYFQFYGECPTTIAPNTTLDIATTTADMSLNSTDTSMNTTDFDSSNGCDGDSNILITNQRDTQEWWVAFYVTYCCGVVTNVEIRDNRYYVDWRTYTSYDSHYAFNNDGSHTFSLPLSVRITTESGEVFIGYDVITTFNGNEQFWLCSDTAVTSMFTTTTTDEGSVIDPKEDGLAPINAGIWTYFSIGAVVFVVLCVTGLTALCYRMYTNHKLYKAERIEEKDEEKGSQSEALLFVPKKPTTDNCEGEGVIRRPTPVAPEGAIEDTEFVA